MSAVELTNLFGREEMTYEEILKQWNAKKVVTPFSGHFLIDFTVEINSIEGMTLTYNQTKELFENETVLGYTGDIRDLFSVLNNVNLSDYLNASLVSRAEITVPFILESHRILMRNSLDKRSYESNKERPGVFRKRDYCVGKYQVGSQPKDIEPMLNELLNYLGSNKDKDILKLGTMFHCNFEYIHPFSDGNGRLGRWLLNYFLVLNNRPPLIIRTADKEEYYNCLERFDLSEDYSSMYNFLKRQQEKSYSSIKEMMQRC